MRDDGSEVRGGGVDLFGAIDLGTNNCRLLVARRDGDGFRVVDAFSRIVRLGEGLGATGRLSEAAMARALEALEICAAKMRRRRVRRYRGVATEACRRAANGAEFLSEVGSVTGLRLETIDPGEEAALALTGCAGLLDGPSPRALLFDIGGGSTEVTWLARNEYGAWQIDDAVSLSRGVVSLSERFGGDRIGVESYEAMVADVAVLLAPFDARHRIQRAVDAGTVQMLGTSGTVTTLSGMKMNLKRYDRQRVDGSWLERGDIEATSRQLAELDWAGRAAYPCVGPERADLVVAGCAILEAICRLWPVARVRVADRGLREGILLGLMRGERGERRLYPDQPFP